MQLIISGFNFMILHATIESERGKAISKSGNEYLNIDIKSTNRTSIYTVEVESREFEICLTVNNLITGEKEIFSVPHE